MLPTFSPGTILVGAASYILKPKAGLPVVFNHKGRTYIKRLKKLNSKGAWVEGDDKTSSTDSREFGYIKPDKIQAVVFMRLN
jgi:hypothetical protein